jgi:hypothetical protein
MLKCLPTRAMTLTAMVMAFGCSKSPPPDTAAPAASSSSSAAPMASVAPAPALEPILAEERPTPMGTPKAPVDLKAPPKDALRTPSGLAYVVVESGKGTRTPALGAQVVAHYAAWTTNGKMFDSSFGRGEPSTFDVSGVINGWSEGLQMMHVGDRYRLWVPSKLAYGDDPKPGIPRGMVIFDVQLLEIKEKPVVVPPQAPTCPRCSRRPGEAPRIPAPARCT